MSFKPRPMKAHNGYDTKEASDLSQAKGNWGPSLTVQSQAEDADINVIMHRFGITGRMPENPHIPMYGDFTQVTDYRTALESVRNAHDRFMELPATLRAKFDNDPQQFLVYVNNKENLPEMRTLGLAKPLPPEPVPAPKPPETKTTTT